jgi:hypothetical protein
LRGVWKFTPVSEKLPDYQPGALDDFVNSNLTMARLDVFREGEAKCQGSW